MNKPLSFEDEVLERLENLDCDLAVIKASVISIRKELDKQNGKYTVC